MGHTTKDHIKWFTFEATLGEHLLHALAGTEHVQTIQIGCCGPSLHVGTEFWHMIFWSEPLLRVLLKGHGIIGLLLASLLTLVPRHGQRTTRGTRPHGLRWVRTKRAARTRAIHCHDIWMFLREPRAYAKGLWHVKHLQTTSHLKPHQKSSSAPNSATPTWRWDAGLQKTVPQLQPLARNLLKKKASNGSTEKNIVCKLFYEIINQDIVCDTLSIVMGLP